MKRSILLIFAILQSLFNHAQTISSEGVKMKSMYRNFNRLGYDDDYIYATQNLRLSSTPEPKSSVMSYLKISREDLSEEIIIKEKLSFGVNKAIYLTGVIEGDNLFELYYAGRYRFFPIKNADRFIYLVKRDLDSFNIVGAPKMLLGGKFTGGDRDMKLFVDDEGLFVVDFVGNNIKRFDYDLNQLWSIETPYLDIEDKSSNEQVKSSIYFKKTDNALIVSSNYGKCKDCERGFLEQQFKKGDNKVNFVISVIYQDGSEKRFVPEIPEAIAYRKFNTFFSNKNKDLISGVFELYSGKFSKTCGFKFYVWDINTGEVINESALVLKEGGVINEGIKNFSKILWGKLEDNKIDTDKNVIGSEMEYCEQLSNGDYLLSFSLYNHLKIKYNLTRTVPLSEDNLYKCCYYVCLSSTGEVKWAKSSVFDGHRLEFYNKSAKYLYTITDDLKLITINYGFSDNYSHGEYKLKTLKEPTKSDCYVLSVIDLKNGDMIKSSSIKLGGIRKSVIDEVFVLKDDPSNALFITRELLKSNALQLFYLNSID